jgi:hypothetical protein
VRPLLLTVASLVLAAGVVSAQEVRPPVEIAAGIGQFASIRSYDFEGPSIAPVADFRVTLPFSPRFSLEGGMALGHEGEHSFQLFEGAYSVQVKQRLVRASQGGFHPFLTYGAMGYFERRRYPAYSFTRPDGTLVSEPGGSYTNAILPLLAVFGGGVRQQLGSRVAIRADAQLITILWIPVGTKLSTGLTVSVGSRRARR